MSRLSFTHRFAAGSFLMVVTLLTASTAWAVTGSGCISRFDTPAFAPVSSYPIGYGYGCYHASTAAEGFLRGRAAVIDSLGNFQVNEGQAEILREQARSLDRENNLKQTEALQYQLKMIADARVQARNDRNVRAAEGQQLLAVRQATVYSKAYQLSSNELNLKTGEISWPVTMRDTKFEENRTHIEELFRQFVGYGERRADTANEIARAVDKWSRSLRNDVSSMPREDYMAAQKFLMGLKYGAASMVEST